MNSAVETRAKIQLYVVQKGPALPVQVSKNVGGSPLFIGAFLSELVSSGQLMITKAKIGNSPLYYANGQEEKIQILREHLGQMQKKAFDLIKEWKVIREVDMEPAERVAMSEIPDFAFPLKVDFDDGSERFWKWYLLSDDEAKVYIKQILEADKSQDSKENRPETEEKEKIPETPVERSECTPEDDKSAENKPKEKPVTEEVEKQEVLTSEKTILDEFEDNMKDYLENQGLNIEDIKVLKKNKEVNFIVTMDSPLGLLRYFVKARSKKKVNEGDLSLAYSEGSAMSLPIIFLSDGELTKKGAKYIENQLRGLVFTSIK